MSEQLRIPDDVEHAEVIGFVEMTTDALWPLWTTAEGLERWWWPMFDDTHYEIDGREGGSYRIQTGEGGFGVHGRYLQLDEGERIAQSWIWLSGDDEGAREELVTIDFAEVEGGVRIVVRQTAPIDEVEDFQQGWQDCLTRLEELADD